MIQIRCPAAYLANEVMVGLAGDNLVFSATPAQVGLADDVQIAKLLQGAIDGGQVNVGLIGRDLAMDLLGAGVTIQLAEGLQDDGPLRGQAGTALANLVLQRL